MNDTDSDPQSPGASNRGDELWPAVDYAQWSETCDTLHAHSQVLGKVAAALAPPEPQLQHTALRLTARGWETHALPAPDHSGALVLGLDLHGHVAFVEHSDGAVRRVALTPDRAVGDVTRAVLAAVTALGGTLELELDPQEVWWTTRLDQDQEHATYDADAVARYLAAASKVALVLAAFRAPYRGRSTSVNAWWGSFDLAVSLFSGLPAKPPSADFIMRNAMDSQEVAVGWWPGDPRYPKAAFYAYAHPHVGAFARAGVEPDAARWDDTLGEFILDWEDVRSSADPYRTALTFARSVFSHACATCEWAPALLASTEGDPPPIR
ncbi:MAG: hypothetical protein KGL16_09805 [Acidobacteriota bacterium]|nr:hypothetical protein [Acidobacteriota bacterium]